MPSSLRSFFDCVFRSIVVVLTLCVVATSGASTTWAATTTLDAVRSRGHLICGIGEGVPGFADVNRNGVWTGLEVDFCGAVAAAIFGKKDAVKFRPLTASRGFNALRDGEIDLIARAVSWTMTRDTELTLGYAGTLFHDGQGFMVRKGYAVSSVLELSGSSVCVLTATVAERNLSEFFTSKQMRYQQVLAGRWADVVGAYGDGGCTLLTGDISQLAAERARLRLPSDHVILPELISKEPSGPVVRSGDQQWLAVVRWVLNALIAAEELGVTRDVALAEPPGGISQDARRLLGFEGNLGAALGLDVAWARNMIGAMGNYGEIYDRHFGEDSPLALERGVNKLWSKGGLMFAAPMR